MAFSTVIARWHNRMGDPNPADVSKRKRCLTNVAIVLGVLGIDSERARRAAQIFRQHDEESVRAMAKLNPDDDEYISIARLHVENLERALQSDRAMFLATADSERDGKEA